MTVYLSGGIQGFTDEEKFAWRIKAKSLLNAVTIDPTRISYKDRSAGEIVELDKKDIRSSSFVLVYFIRPSVGTSMEILYAYEQEIPVYVVNEFKKELSPWMLYHASYIFNTLEEAIDKINYG